MIKRYFQRKQAQRREQKLFALQLITKAIAAERDKVIERAYASSDSSEVVAVGNLTNEWLDSAAESKNNLISELK